MGLFSTDPPKPPKGTTHRATGKDRLENWSMYRIQAELRRIEAAKAFRDEVNPVSSEYMKQLREFNEKYLPVDKRGDMTAGRGGALVADRNRLIMNGIYGPSSGLNMPRFNNEFGRRDNAIGSVDATYDRIVRMNEEMQGMSSAPEPSPIFGSRFGKSQEDPYANIDREQFATDFASLQEARSAFDEERNRLKEMAKTSQSGLGALDIGDEYWLARLKNQLTVKRAELSRFQNRVITPKRVDDAALTNRDEREAKGVRQRGVGQSVGTGPLETTTQELGGVI